MVKLINSLLVICLLLSPVAIVRTSSASPAVPELIFTEVKVRSDSSSSADYDEFIEIYNSSEAPVRLANYNVEYFNSTNPSGTDQPSQKTLPNLMLGSHNSVIFTKKQIMVANSTPYLFSSLADTGGRLKLVTSEGQVVDEIAWTNSQLSATAEDVFPATIYQCNNSTALCNSNRTQSISREIDELGNFVLENPKWLLADPTPVSSELLSIPDTEEPPDEETTPEEVPEDESPKYTCEGIIITELLANPSGVDTGKEFIELYNPTEDFINLKGCSMQSSSSTKKYNFVDLEIAPGGYRHFLDSETSLVLPNAAGGSVWLLSPTEELSRVVYPAEIGDDVSWSLIDDVWQVSYVATPGKPNIYAPDKPCSAGQYRDPETNSCRSIVVQTLDALTPCKAGQERNPETNRCRNIAESVVSLVACKEGQERNPETNRCRNTITTASALTPCKAGQIRNPETNRCRSVSDTTSELKPCEAGQERNPETNRCRKVSGSSSNGKTLAAVTDVSSNVKSSPKWWLAIGAIALAVGYAAYEWRKDVYLFAFNLRNKFSKR